MSTNLRVSPTEPPRPKVRDVCGGTSTLRLEAGCQHPQVEHRDDDRPRAVERGVLLYDFGRSKNGTGSFDFKKNWGFEATPLHYEYCLYGRDSVPQHNPANPRYRAAIDLWRRLPRGVVNAVGPALARHLG